MNNSQVTLEQIEVGQSVSLQVEVYTRQPKGHRDTKFGTIPVVNKDGKLLAFDSNVRVRRLPAQR
jgi:hypothetical protein